jgi:hypothetical protein
MRRTWLVLMLTMAAVAGCAAQAGPATDNVSTVARNLSKGLPEQSRLLMCLVASPRQCQGMPGPSDRDVVRAHVRDNATLTCEIAQRDNQATAAASPACQCAQAKTPDQFELACASWAGVQ